MHSPLPPRRAGLLAGVLAAGAALGVGQLVAGITGPSGSPVVEVGQLQIDLTPPWLKNFAIREFGGHDKAVLVSGILVVVAALAAALGVLGRRRLGYALAGLAGFGVIGLIAAGTRPTFAPVDVAPTLAATAVAGLTLVALLRIAAPGRAGIDLGLPRRQFLAASVVTAGAAAVTGLAGRLLTDRLDVAAARSALRLPAPVRPAPPLPAGVDLRIPGLAPFITPNPAFYRVDTAILLPQVDPQHWRLRIHGRVTRELTLSFDDLLSLPLVEDDITLCCVSNPVAGPYIGNARWLGASLAALLRRAGIRAGADQLLCTSTDGFTSGTPIQTVMDGRDALLAVGMNGQPLPVAHGFPVRMVVPGLYGYVSATKWVTDIKVTTYAAEVAYWAQRGWSQQAPIKTESRIDVPSDGQTIPAGPTTVAGVAWAQHKGIDAVEVRVDRGPWQPARLAAAPGIDTWRQWSWTWPASRGDHVLESRATDATGYVQTDAPAPPEPNGATGYPTIHVRVR